MTTAWIQKSDYSTVDLSKLDLEEAIKNFKSFEWETEIKIEKEKIEKGLDCCPAGFGLNYKEESILHICPIGNKLSNVHFHFKERKNIFWFFNYFKDKPIFKENMNNKSSIELITLFFEGKMNNIIGILTDN